MADRPILFSAPMVQALLAGRKTQTRRALNPQPYDFVTDGKRYWNASGQVGGRICISDIHLASLHRWVIGDRLYVREEYYQRGHWWQDENDVTAKGKSKWKFAAYDHEITFEPPSKFLKARSRTNPGEIYWYKRLGRFMPRRYSRLTLTVTDVRVERLQNCSEADAIAEGVQTGDGADGPVAEYEALWSSINGPDAWDANPWVVAVSFDAHRCNIDQMPTPRPTAAHDEGGVRHG